jgi:chromosome segregation ATPase
MTKLSVREIQKLGFDWPRYTLVEQYSEVQEGRVDLSTTIEKLQSSRAFYRSQLNQAFAFKQQTGADYSDFTDRHDEYARMERELREAIAYLERIVQASDSLGDT